MAFAVKTHAAGLRHVFEIAENIRKRLISVFEIMDRLCQSTCRWCPDPCCLHAVVWIDFKDLLFFHLSGHPGPPEQLIYDYGATCRYAGPKGCRLNRISRPWICTYYLCPAQTGRLRKTGRNDFLEELRWIKTARNQLHDEFIRVISPDVFEEAINPMERIRI